MCIVCAYMHLRTATYQCESDAADIRADTVITTNPTPISSRLGTVFSVSLPSHRVANFQTDQQQLSCLLPFPLQLAPLTRRRPRMGAMC